MGGRRFNIRFDGCRYGVWAISQADMTTREETLSEETCSHLLELPGLGAVASKSTASCRTLLTDCVDLSFVTPA